ncbi:MAG TPA: ABC transporter permease [Candidatus Lustribacter sp.]|nr:ABC transporter permease [Candidatus Lustribacter sp.]
MTTLVTHSTLLTRRSLTALLRQPAYLAITLVQPMIWLLLFGQLFSTVVDIPGFAREGTFLEFLTPGVVAMTALFSASWAGTVYIEDMGLGVMDRLLASPVRRGAMMNGTLIYQGIIAVAQTVAVLVVAVLAGARFGSPVGGFVVTIGSAVLLTVVFSALSNAVALLVRQQEALIGISQMLALPMTFLSSAVMDVRLAPTWIERVATYNPLDWAVRASREALSATPDWGVVGSRLGLLAALALLMAWLATRAFGVYQRSV